MKARGIEEIAGRRTKDPGWPWLLSLFVFVVAFPLFSDAHWFWFSLSLERKDGDEASTERD
jgi:hypothetical protein